MIAKQIKGKHFYGLLAIMKIRRKRLGICIDCGITHDTTINITEKFNMVRQLCPRLGKAVHHVSLSLPHGDNLAYREFKGLAFDYLQGTGFDDDHYTEYRHAGTKHEDIHIIANKVQYSEEVRSPTAGATSVAKNWYENWKPNTVFPNWKVSNSKRKPALPRKKLKKPFVLEPHR